MKTTEAIPATLVSSPPLWRLQLVRALQIIGVVGGFFGGAEFLQLLAIMPPDVAGWLLVAGPAFAAGSRPFIELIGDLVDDGIHNDSFKIPLGLFLLVAATMTLGLGLSSCAGLSFAVSPEGCALARYSQDGQTYYAGPCVGADGKVDRYVTQWQNDTGDTIRLTRFAGSKENRIHYKGADGSWIEWSSKSGVLLGPAPVELNNLKQ